MNDPMPCPSGWERRAIRVEIEADAADGFVSYHGWMVVRADSPDDRELGRLWLDGDSESTDIWSGTRIYPEVWDETDQEIISRVLDHIQGFPLGSQQGTREKGNPR